MSTKPTLAQLNIKPEYSTTVYAYIYATLPLSLPSVPPVWCGATISGSFLCAPCRETRALARAPTIFSPLGGHTKAAASLPFLPSPLPNAHRQTLTWLYQWPSPFSFRGLGSSTSVMLRPFFNVCQILNRFIQNVPTNLVTIITRPAALSGQPADLGSALAEGRGTSQSQAAGKSTRQARM